MSVRVGSGLVAAIGLALSLMLVAPGTANAVPGAIYSQPTCHTKGSAGRGSVWGYRAKWSSYKCIKNASGGWRLHVYNVERVSDAGVIAGSYFPGSSYPSRSACEAAGARKKGTYKGTAVTWKAHTCNVSGNGDGRRVLSIKGVS